MRKEVVLILKIAVARDRWMSPDPRRLDDSSPESKRFICTHTGMRGRVPRESPNNAAVQVLGQDVTLV